MPCPSSAVMSQVFRPPIRMNPAYVTVRLLNRGVETATDPDFREPVSFRKYAPEVELTGQLVGARGFFKLARTQTGDSNPSTGQLVFRPDDLARVGVTLQKGDRIVKINGVDVDFNIIKVSPLSPYRGRFLLIHVEFEQQRKTTESV